MHRCNHPVASVSHDCNCWINKDHPDNDGHDKQGKRNAK